MRSQNNWENYPNIGHQCRVSQTSNNQVRNKHQRAKQMPLHHYLPASFLARFSADSRVEPARDRLLIVGDKKNQKWFKAPASKVGCIKNLYTLVNDSISPDIVDQTWSEYERNLPTAIDNLINRNIDAEIWTRVLVPFVSCMLVRGPDFTEKFNRRWPHNRPEQINKLLTNDNANRARLMDLQRLLGFVSTAKWLVLTTQGTEKLITNDLGYSPFINPIYGDKGIGIPLDHNIILAIIPTTKDHPIFYEKDNKWVPIINYLDLPPDNHHGLNKALAQNALRFIFGSDKSAVQKYVQGTPLSSSSPEPEELGFPDGRFSRAHEFTWHRLVSAIKKHPSDKEGWDFSLDWKVIASGWYPPPILPANLIEFPPVLKRVKNSICTRFYDPEIYYSISRILMLEEGGHHDTAIKEATNALTNKLSSSLRARILSIRGNILADIGKNREAMKDFEEAITFDRSTEDLYVNYGYALLKVGNSSKAFKILSKAIKLNPNHGIAYSNRSIAQWKIGRQNEAIKDSTIAINLLPDGVEKASAFLNRGKILSELGMQEQASDDFAQAEKLFKNKTQ